MELRSLGGGRSLVVLTATRLNSQRGQGRLLFTSSYESDIMKVCVIYFILVVLRLVRYSLFYEVYMKKVTNAKQNCISSFINTFMVMYLC